MFNQAVLKRSLITCIALGAAACPAAAAARAIEPGDLGAPPPSVQTVHAQVVHTAGTPTTDFQWDDAGIGAAAAIVLLGAGGIAAGGLRRRQTQHEALS